MMHTNMKIETLCAISLAFIAAVGYSATGVELKPVLTTPGKLVFGDDFPAARSPGRGPSPRATGKSRMASLPARRSRRTSTTRSWPSLSPAGIP